MKGNNIQSAVLAFLLVFTTPFFAAANQDAKAPLPKERPYEVWIRSIDDKDLFESLKSINDKNAQKRIIEALKGNCLNQNNLKKNNIGKAVVNINHKQCRPAGPKSKGGKDGQKCQIQGVQGGSVEAMCVNGCCVQISSSKSEPLFAGQPGARNSASDNSLMNSPASQGMFKSIFDNLFKMFSGGSGGSGTSSDYQPYDYQHVADSVDDSVIDGFYSENNNDSGIVEYDSDKTDTITHKQSKTDEAQTQNSVNTKNNNIDVETELYKTEYLSASDTNASVNTKPIYRAFSKSTDSYTKESQNNKPETIVEEQSISIAYNNNFEKKQNDNYIYKDSSATGFNNSEKITVQELSFWQKIILAIKSVFGL